MKKLIFFFVLFLLGACTNLRSREVEETQKKIIKNPKAYDFIIEEQYPGNRPTWTYNLDSVKDKYKEYELFTGISTFSQDEYTATKLAEENAINQIAKYLGVHVESELKSYNYKETKDNNETFSTSIEEKTKQVVESFAKNLKVLEKYVEKGKFYDPRGFWRPYTRVILLYGVKSKG